MPPERRLEMRAGSCRPDRHFRCRLTIVAFWISTLLPEFWITVDNPAEPANAPSLMAFEPVVRMLALLLATTPLSCMSLKTTPSPPRFEASASSVNGLLPNGLGATIATTDAGGDGTDDDETVEGVATTPGDDDETEGSAAMSESVHDKAASAATLMRVMRLALNMATPVATSRKRAGALARPGAAFAQWPSVRLAC